jgi:hypothetical protein
MRRRLAWLAGVAGAIGFAWLTFRRVEWSAVQRELASLPGWAFALALGLKAAAFGIVAARSRVLLGPLRPPGLPVLYRSVLIAFVGNNLLPLRAGELLRIGYLARRGGLAPAACLSAIALERTLDVLCLLGLCALVLPELLAVLPPGSALVGLAALAVLGAGLALAISWRPRAFLGLAAWILRPLPARAAAPAFARISELVDGLAALASTRGVLASLGWTLGYWLCMSGGISVWLAAFDLRLPISAPFVVLMFISLQALLPIPAQIGSYHYFAAAALGSLGVDPTRAASFALVLHFMSFVPFTLIGIALAAGEWGQRALRPTQPSA